MNDMVMIISTIYLINVKTIENIIIVLCSIILIVLTVCIVVYNKDIFSIEYGYLHCSVFRLFIFISSVVPLIFSLILHAIAIYSIIKAVPCIKSRIICQHSSKDKIFTTDTIKFCYRIFVQVVLFIIVRLVIVFYDCLHCNNIIIIVILSILLFMYNLVAIYSIVDAVLSIKCDIVYQTVVTSENMQCMYNSAVLVFVILCYFV